ncbi:dephospho-CoA kinase [Sporosarcina sp. NCCP-2222]|uniref:dephospho-CoA kinase n=1 Tax=Sporosarcina sp. NCCP-2222 TaxID=2935073 RepID=UPI00200AF79F|nr:dephospho-CoA kinase [Sporosarcina sp. NCCP-2222]GKV54570.1 dephospho-CoA kinase [Sporosarcina sp. NCCP-2222]
MIIGLTGSIASGKSTVAAMLREKGYPIVDADEISRLVVEPGSPVLCEIKKAFGDEVIMEDGQLNRAKLGDLIFNDIEKRQQLNGIIHPAVRKEMLRQKEEWVAKGASTVIMDIPLLFESRLQPFVDKILVVSVTKDLQKSRLMARNGLSEAEAESRISSQLPMEVKERGADAIVDNNGALEATKQQLEAVLEEWKAEPLF